MKFLCLLTLAIFGILLTSCKKCGECYVTVDGKEEMDTRSKELCGDDYETLQTEEEDIVNAWETVYPKAEINYVCEDK